MLGTFRIVTLLGRGGMATVYEAYDTRLERAVALKVLPPQFLHDQTFARRFEQEARVVARLEHPAIVSIYASGTDEGIPWMSMRLLGGGNMGTLLKHTRPDPSRVMGILNRVAEALDYAHAQGVVHRDIKPTNILFDRDERPCVGDFGLAQMMDGNAVVTRAGMVIGTPHYMAPEQALGKGVDRRCDVYSLGIVAYEMLAGTVPFRGDSPVAVLLQHVNDPLPPVPSGQLPEPVLRAIQKAAAKDPAERWPSAGAFAEALDAGFRAARSTPAIVPPSATGLAAWPSRPWLRPRAIAAVALLGAAALALTVSLPTRDRLAPPPGSNGEAPSNVQTRAPFTGAGIEPVTQRDPPQPPEIRRRPDTTPVPPPSAGNTPSQPALTPAPAGSAITAAAPEPPATQPLGPDGPVEAPPTSSPPAQTSTAPATPPPTGPAATAPPSTPPAAKAAPPPADVIVPPRRIRTVKPRYPEVARAAQLKGDVHLRVTVGADGRIGEVVVERSADSVFNQAAIEAVRRSEYLPGHRNGVPTESSTTTTIRFDLDR